MLTITLSLPPSAQGKTIGLTGLFDGDKTNDLYKLDGSGYIPASSTVTILNPDEKIDGCDKTLFQ